MLDLPAPLTWKGQQSACILVVQFDGYFRPSEVLPLVPNDVPGGARSHSSVPVIIRSSPDDPEGSKADLTSAKLLRPQSRPSKTGEYDGTVLVADTVSKKAERVWVGKVLNALVRRSLKRDQSGTSPLVALTLADYSRVLRAAVIKADLHKLRVTPHTARHGGASADAFLHARSYDQIKQRGQWKSESSVARYRKIGMYARHNRKLNSEQRKAALKLYQSLPPLLITAAGKDGPSGYG